MTAVTLVRWATRRAAAARPLRQAPPAGRRKLGTVLDALEESGDWNDTAIIFTSDHGDMRGSHGVRSKGPFVYDEIMRVPCCV
ncbi:sulfatase-like hydrolase/transferase [Streptomyces sp. NPDC058430]|uniref:sulfatase-like hydrolase/transferase n=1 Tax=Streptomyces sp. NPDC058430 TaxID=3346495 RepID=UPI00364AAE81